MGNTQTENKNKEFLERRERLKRQLENAIKSRSVLKIDYLPGERTVEPHALGYNAQGKLLLRAYQLSGNSLYNKGDWKLFAVDKMGDLFQIIDTYTQVRPGYNRNDPVFTKILASADSSAVKGAKGSV